MATHSHCHLHQCHHFNCHQLKHQFLCQYETPRPQPKPSIIKSCSSIGKNSAPPSSLTHTHTHSGETLLFDSTGFGNRFNTSAQVSGQHRCSYCTNIPHPSEGRADPLSVRECGKHSQSRHFGHPAGAYGYTPVSLTLLHTHTVYMPDLWMMMILVSVVAFSLLTI